MKRVQDDLDIRSAFSPVPEDVKNRLIHTANSVKEEEKVKKYTWKAAVIAVAIMIATMSVGLAASELVGWTDFFSHFYNIELPSEAQKLLNQTEQVSYEVGPLTLTVQELLCDGENAFTSIVARTTDGSPAVITSWGEWNTPICANGMENEAHRLGVDPMTTWRVAAQTVDQPLYAVRAIPEVAYNLMNGDQMEDYLHDAEGGFVNFSSVPVRADKVGDALPMTYYLYVAEVDAETGDVKQDWTERKAGEIAVVSSVLAEKTYHPAIGGPIYGYELESVLIEMRVTGGYATMTFVAPEGATEESWWDDAWPILVDAVTLCDADGEPYKMGIGLSISADISNWPTVAVRQTLSMSELPETVQVTVLDINEMERAEPQTFEVELPGN